MTNNLHTSMSLLKDTEQSIRGNIYTTNKVPVNTGFELGQFPGPVRNTITDQVIVPKNNEQVKKHSHYYKDVSKLSHIDVYRVIDLFGVTDPCIQHAIKKLLVTGGRDGNKTSEQDIRDVIASCNRWLEMQAENS